MAVGAIKPVKWGVMIRVNTKDTKGGRKEAQRRLWEFCVWSFIVLFLAGCGANDTVLRAGKETPSQVTSATSTFASDLESMRTAGFSFIYVLRRKDSELMNNEDRGVIRLNTALANRRFSADEGRAFIIGSNPPIPPQNMAALYERFAVEDYSPPPASNTNAHANK